MHQAELLNAIQKPVLWTLLSRLQEPSEKSQQQPRAEGASSPFTSHTPAQPKGHAAHMNGPGEAQSLAVNTLCQALCPGPD